MTSFVWTVPAAHQPLYALRLAIACAARSARRAWTLARERQRRAALDRAAWKELRELDDRMLDDIGLRFSDLPWIARHDPSARLGRDAHAWRSAFGTRIDINWR